MTPEQQTLAEGALLIAAALGVGGDQWAVHRAAGDGLSGPAGLVPLGTWAGHVKRSKPTQVQPAAPGVPVPATEWHAVGELVTFPALDGSTLALAVGDTLTSEADPGLRFAIIAPYAVAGYARFILRPL
ncbi:MAG TPA: hypothetical protein PKD53_04775 [Chloroflexaceae bacterium]|nr:hypothetical protein [Chloroflexaceae bacterium]